MKTNPNNIFELLRKYESQNITYVSPNGSWPIVWERAQGMYVWDATGKRHLDLTGAFGVAAAGHANRRVVQAGKQQIAAYHLEAACPLLVSWVCPLTLQQQDKSLKKVPAGQTPIMRLELVERIIADALPVRFQAQLHKIIWSPEQRGV